MALCLKRQGKYRFNARLGLHAYGATMQAHDLTRQAEADTGAVGLGGEKRDEDVVECFCHDASAIVPHLQPHAAGVIEAGVDGGAAALHRRELQARS